jgi:DNA-binding LacI/PurR family transcriptional regulator
MKRPTITDIAQRAGVTKAAVSFALNGQPGVSAATRERILAIAAEIGFQPNSAARALTAGRAGAFGLAVQRPAGSLGIEPFLMQLISGIQRDLAGYQVCLQFAVTETAAAEIELYRQWWAQRRVDGVFLVDLLVNDDRIAAIEELRIPAVVLGAAEGAGTLPAISSDSRAAAEAVTGYLAACGHRRVARVGGHPAYWHSRLRRDAFEASAVTAGLTAYFVEVGPAEAATAGADSAGAGLTGAAGYGSPAAMAQLTVALLGAAEPPTAICYDSDVLAAAGLGAAQRMGVSVPGAVSLISWDDSPLCELMHPGLTALRRDIAGVGATAARMLRELAAGGRPESVLEPAPALQIRASSSWGNGPGIQAPARSRRSA